MAVPPPKPPAGAAAAPPDAGGRTRGDELADECGRLEAEVEELKVKYEMYFLGVELREPNRLRDDLKKKVLRIKEKFTRNTGLRFRIQTLYARFLSYERLWQRSAREREEGTYRRDLAKARRRGGSAGAPAAPAATAARGAKGAESEDVDLSDLGAAPAPAAPRPAPAQPAAAPARAAAARPAAPAPPPAGGAALGDAQLRQLYDTYIAAKRRCNEDVSRLTFDSVSKSVSKQIPEILRQHNARSVEFRVVIKDGKAKLTAVPKA